MKTGDWVEILVNDILRIKGRHQVISVSTNEYRAKFVQVRLNMPGSANHGMTRKFYLNDDGTATYGTEHIRLVIPPRPRHLT